MENSRFDDLTKQKEELLLQIQYFRPRALVQSYYCLLGLLFSLLLIYNQIEAEAYASYLFMACFGYGPLLIFHYKIFTGKTNLTELFSVSILGLVVLSYCFIHTDGNDSITTLLTFVPIVFFLVITIVFINSAKVKNWLSFTNNATKRIYTIDKFLVKLKFQNKSYRDILTMRPKSINLIVFVKCAMIVAVLGYWFFFNWLAERNIVITFYTIFYAVIIIVYAVAVYRGLFDVTEFIILIFINFVAFGLSPEPSLKAFNLCSLFCIIFNLILVCRRNTIIWSQACQHAKKRNSKH